MYSFYLLHRSDLVNNNGETAPRFFVLNDRDDLAWALADIAATDADTDSGADVLELRVYQRGRLAHVRDLRQGGERGGFIVEDADHDVPPLEGTALPPGHPVMVEGRMLHYGYSTCYA